jgi:light-independent protochlorophyllide reductase subunit B
LGSEGEGARSKSESGEVINEGNIVWAFEAEKELRKIPFFVRGKARRNTERFAEEQGISTIQVDTLYDAKAHFSS